MRRAIAFSRRRRSLTSILSPHQVGERRFAQRAAERARSVFAAVAILAFATQALAGDPADLPTTRTDLSPKDAKRVEAVTRPTSDFSKPEQFELMQGGA